MAHDVHVAVQPLDAIEDHVALAAARSPARPRAMITCYRRRIGGLLAPEGKLLHESKWLQAAAILRVLMLVLVLMRMRRMMMMMRMRVVRMMRMIRMMIVKRVIITDLNKIPRPGPLAPRPTTIQHGILNTHAPVKYVKRQ